MTPTELKEMKEILAARIKAAQVYSDNHKRLLLWFIQKCGKFSKPCASSVYTTDKEDKAMYAHLGLEVLTTAIAETNITNGLPFVFAVRTGVFAHLQNGERVFLGNCKRVNEFAFTIFLTPLPIVKGQGRDMNLIQFSLEDMLDIEV